MGVAIGFLLGFGFAIYLGILTKRDAEKRYISSYTARFWGVMVFGFAGFALPVYLLKRPPMLPERAKQARKRANSEVNQEI